MDPDDHDIEAANRITSGEAADAFAWALDVLGWKIVLQRGSDFPGQDMRWPMHGAEYPCPTWAIDGVPTVERGDDDATP
jgi:hypothetical protein